MYSVKTLYYIPYVIHVTHVYIEHYTNWLLIGIPKQKETNILPWDYFIVNNICLVQKGMTTIRHLQYPQRYSLHSYPIVSCICIVLSCVHPILSCVHPIMLIVYNQICNHQELICKFSKVKYLIREKVRHTPPPFDFM